MTIAYVDTSALLAAVFYDPRGDSVSSRLTQYSQLVSSNLLEAEMRTGFARRGLQFDAAAMSGIEWIMPERPLSQELGTVLSAGYLRGADLWHMATALYVAPDPREITFITLDFQQQAVALALGFQT